MSDLFPQLLTELPYKEDSADYFEVVRNFAWPVFLDSANTQQAGSHYDIIAADPFITIETSGQRSRITRRNGIRFLAEDNPFTVLQDILSAYDQQKTSLPFAGGAIGYFSYDLGRTIESLPDLAEDRENMPEMAVGIYDWAIVNDHQKQRCYLASFGLEPLTKVHWQSLSNDLLNLKNDKLKTSFAIHGEIQTNLDQSQYSDAFNKIQHYITEGDCYQVNLAKRYEISAEGDAWHAYKLLRQYNAAPFSAYFSTPSATVLSSSPERLLSVTNGFVETKPIKGTRPRDIANANHDLQLAVELQNSAKDRAENLMIIDLLRNDLGKVCDPGSIQVPKPFELESFATVHHLVSTITGQLTENQHAVSLLKACFPGGSITGAPKLRAMEVIEELEPHRRGVYCGSIAYIGFDGNMDSNITIRTLVHSDNRLRFWAGGGIVADSNVEAEHQEILDKAAAIFTMLDKLR